MLTAAADVSLESGEDFRRFFDSAPLMMCLVDADMRGAYFNRQWSHFVGVSQDGLCGEQWMHLIHPQDRRRLEEAFHRALEARESFRVECRMRRFDGEYHHALNLGSPQFAEDGQFLGCLVMTVDVNSQKTVEAALTRSEMRCQTVFSSVVGNVAIVDCAGTIIALNDGWLRFARKQGGRLRTVGTGVNYLDVCQRAIAQGDDEATAALNGITRVLDGSLSEFSLEYRCPTRQEELWFEMIVHPLRRQEGGAVITHLNITNRRRAELQAQTLLHELAHVSRVAVLGELTASFAHELSQPLTSIQSNAHAVKHLLEDERRSRAEIVNVVSDIIADNLRAGKILHQLRALLKKDRIKLKPLKLNKLIRGVSDLLGDEAALKRVKVSHFLAPNLPRVRGERIQLQQVILNLIVNAMEAMRRSNTTPRELILETCMSGKDHVAILVRDNGPGIPAKHMDRIFEPFFSTKSNGLGMGLAICRSIVELHGGKISVANNIDRGVTFRIELPVLAGEGV